MSSKEAWLFPQNSCSLEQFFVTLEVLGELNGITRGEKIIDLIMSRQSGAGLYRTYKDVGKFDISSANHKIDEPRFYGAIYETVNNKFHISVYGELLLKYKDDIEKRNKIFLAMMCNIQFSNPYKNKVKNFNIYPVRLILKLLAEEKLNCKLTNIEIAYILYYIKEVKNEEKYNEIVNDIIKFRNLTIDDQKKLLENDSEQFIRNYVSCNYFCNILYELQVTLEKRERSIFKVKSKARKEPTTITYRTITLTQYYKEFVLRLLSDLSIYQNVKTPEVSKNEWIRDIYNSIPDIILNEVKEKTKLFTEYMQIPKLLKDAATDSSKWALFEKYIENAFNLFTDIDAEKNGAPGEPDVLCYYRTQKYKFCIDGKSTKNKLSSINDGRLKQHRKKYDARYTIVVTPSYVPSALEDIKDTNTCILTANCLADIIVKYIMKMYSLKRECTFEAFNDIILSNLGSDISDKVYKFIDDEIGVNLQKSKIA